MSALEERIIRLVANPPKVSVCIPTYNGAAYIGSALDSVFRQSYQDFEIVVVDNCSTDDTAALVEELCKQSEKIRFYRNDRNIGLAGNLNRCMDLAEGEYIKYLCVDDLLEPDCLQRMLDGLEANPRVALACGARASINEQGQAFGLRRYSLQDQVVPGHEVVQRCLFGGNYIGEPTAVMFRKSEMIRGFREELPQLMDMELWFTLLEKGALLSLKDAVCSIRFHAGQMTRENIRSGKLIEDNVLVFEEFSGKPYLKITPWLRLQHKLRMTYRIWVSREHVDSGKRGKWLSQYGLRLLYPFMPLLSFAVVLKRRVSTKSH